MSVQYRAGKMHRPNARPAEFPDAVGLLKSMRSNPEHSQIQKTCSPQKTMVNFHTANINGPEIDMPDLELAYDDGTSSVLHSYSSWPIAIISL